MTTTTTESGEKYLGFEEALTGSGFVKLEAWDPPGSVPPWTVAPKEMDIDILAVECIYRNDVEAYWRLLQNREKHDHIPGLVLAGPPGAGKSTIVYMLALTARRHGWLVVYIVSLFVLSRAPLSPHTQSPPPSSFDRLTAMLLFVRQADCGKWKKHGEAQAMGVFLDRVVIGVSTLQTKEKEEVKKEFAFLGDFIEANKWAALADSKKNHEDIEDAYNKARGVLDGYTR